MYRMGFGLLWLAADRSRGLDTEGFSGFRVEGVGFGGIRFKERASKDAEPSSAAPPSSSPLTSQPPHFSHHHCQETL